MEGSQEEKKKRQRERMQELQNLRKSNPSKGKVCKVLACEPAQNYAREIMKSDNPSRIEKVLRAIKSLEKKAFELGITPPMHTLVYLAISISIPTDFRKIVIPICSGPYTQMKNLAKRLNVEYKTVNSDRPERSLRKTEKCIKDFYERTTEDNEFKRQVVNLTQKSFKIRNCNYLSPNGILCGAGIKYTYFSRKYTDIDSHREDLCFLCSKGHIGVINFEQKTIQYFAS